MRNTGVGTTLAVGDGAVDVRNLCLGEGVIGVEKGRVIVSGDVLGVVRGLLEHSVIGKLRTVAPVYLRVF